MLTVNYITRPYFIDISLELIQELKVKCVLNVIIIISPWNINYMDINDNSVASFGKPFKLTEKMQKQFHSQYKDYFNGANIFFKYEEIKDSSLKNTLRWIKLLLRQNSILKADLHILESLSFADLYFLFKIRNKKICYIFHDPVPHTGENRKRLELISKFLFKYIDKFLLYSSFSTKVFKSRFPDYANKTITLKTPLYNSLKKPITTDRFCDKKINILFFGRISPYKGVDLFYAAAELLCKEFDKVSFTIAGKCIDNYNPLFLESNHPNIHIYNCFIDNDKKADLMRNSTLCVLPYLDATQSGVVMTAYASDLPVLVSDCEGLLEYCFDQKNFSFKNGDLSDLINKMRNILLNQDLLKSYKEKIASYAKTNVSANNVNKILGVE